MINFRLSSQPGRLRSVRFNNRNRFNPFVRQREKKERFKPSAKAASFDERDDEEERGREEGDTV